jgi:photosystem II stability/assembly factor-like uncharacterized protein
MTVSNQGNILASDRYGRQPSTWTVKHSASHGLKGLVFVPNTPAGKSIWVAVGNYNLVVRTENGGTTWTELNGALPGASWQWIAYGKGRLVAVGNADVHDPAYPPVASGQTDMHTISAGVIMYSDDFGVTWTKADSGTQSYLSSISYSPELNVFVAVGHDGAIISVAGPV